MIDILLFFSSSGEWVNQGEAFLTSDDEPAQFNEDSAALLNQKIDDHKQFFENYERTMEQLKQWTAKAGPDVPAEQLQSLVKRFVYFFNLQFFLTIVAWYTQVLSQVFDIYILRYFSELNSTYILLIIYTI